MLANFETVLGSILVGTGIGFAAAQIQVLHSEQQLVGLASAAEGRCSVTGTLQAVPVVAAGLPVAEQAAASAVDNIVVAEEEQPGWAVAEPELVELVAVGSIVAEEREEQVAAAEAPAPSSDLAAVGP